MSESSTVRTRDEVFARYLSFLNDTKSDPLHFHRFALEEVLFRYKACDMYGNVVSVMRSYIVDIAWPSTHESFNPVTINRNVVCLREWAWILDDTEATDFLSDDSNFDPLGVPMLRFMCDRYLIPVPDHIEEIESNGKGRRGD